MLKNKPLTLRWVTYETRPRVLELLQVCYPKDRWTDGDLREFASRHGLHQCNIVKALVCPDGEVHGVLLYNCGSRDKHVHIRRVGVWPDERRQSLGTRMVQTLLDTPFDNYKVTAYVPPSDPSLAFFRSLNFCDTTARHADGRFLLEHSRDS